MSATELSELAHVGWATIQRFESTERVPNSKVGTLLRLKETLEAAGIVFLGDPLTSPGVQLQRRQEFNKTDR